MEIKKASSREISEILHVHELAFGESQGLEIRHLVSRLLEDLSAKPIFSFVALENNAVIGHIHFTKVNIQGASKALPAQILAPLAVLPDYQLKGTGSQLVKTGLNELQKAGIQLVFVLGHPDYYPRYGFSPAGKHGFAAPYPIADEHSDAWMVQELYPGVIETEQGKVLCADSLNRPEHWQE
jgi:predicted N-acetyltransferase YhbS